MARIRGSLIAATRRPPSSVDPSSTTTTSKSGKSCASNAAIVASTVRALLYRGTTTEKNGFAILPLRQALTKRTVHRFYTEQSTERWALVKVDLSGQAVR